MMGTLPGEVFFHRERAELVSRFVMGTCLAYRRNRSKPGSSPKASFQSVSLV
jgi:hypothetical protein